MQIIPHTKPKARRSQLIGLAWIMRAAIEEEDGEVLALAGSKKGSKQNPCWRAIKRVAPECFRKERSEHWAHLVMDELNIVISGGTAQSGKLIATLAPEKEELK